MNFRISFKAKNPFLKNKDLALSSANVYEGLHYGMWCHNVTLAGMVSGLDV
jgi:hypothetical protein